MSAAALKLFRGDVQVELPILSHSSSSERLADVGESGSPTLSLRRFRAPDERLTARNVYDRYLKPELLKAKRKACSIRAYELALERWEEYWRDQYQQTVRAMDTLSIAQDSPDNSSVKPPFPLNGAGAYWQPFVDEVSHKDLSAWQAWLMDGHVPSPRTCNKHTSVLNTILRESADKQHADRPPRLKSLPARLAAPKIYFPLRHLDAIYDACSCANWPRRLFYPAPTYWRAALALYLNYGFRTEELISFKAELPALTWKNVTWEAETPDPTGHAVNEHGWLWYTPEKQKGIKPDPLVLPLNAITAAHLKSILPPGGVLPDDKVFPFPRCGRDFYAQWDAIVTHANVRPKKLLSGEQPEYLLKHLRKTCETAHNNNAGAAQVRNTIGESITGHAARTVSTASYHHFEEEILRAVNSFPQPAAFHKIFDASQRASLQKLLF